MDKKLLDHAAAILGASAIPLSTITQWLSLIAVLLSIGWYGIRYYNYFKNKKTD